jgi:hypothetical protein
MPAMMGKAKAQQKLLDSLDEQFAKVITDQRSSLTVTTLTVYMYSHPSILLLLLLLSLKLNLHAHCF